MALFRSRVLQRLDRIYNFISDKHSTERVDLTSPVQLVHDVSRMAETGSGLPMDQDGFWLTGAIQAHGIAGAGQGTVSIVPTTVLGALDPSDFWTWCVDVEVNCAANEGDLDSILVALVSDNAGNTTFRFNNTVYSWYRPIFYYNSTDGHNHLMEAHSGGGVDLQVHIPIYKPDTPIFIPGDAELTYAFDTGGALSAPGLIVRALMWTGPKGAIPPRFA